MTETPDSSLQQQYAADLAVPDDSEKAFCVAEEDLAAALEALLFAAGDPLPLDKIHQVTGVAKPELQRILAALADRMARDSQRGLLLREIEGSYFLATKPDMKEVLQRLFLPRQRPPLSQAAYETLAVIAYNQPATRSQVEAVRGVNSDNIISRLVERGLVQEAGSLEAPGRPLLYAVTEQFLLDFGLRSVCDLPPMELLMYKTLRDFETSLEEAAGRTRDRQMTIDQLVQAIIPRDDDRRADASPDTREARADDRDDTAQDPDPSARASGDDPGNPAAAAGSSAAMALSEDDVLALSGALFGEESLP